MSNIERNLIEERRVQAIKSNLVGAGGKFGIILKYLGEKMYDSTGAYHDQNSLDDIQNFPQFDVAEIPYFDNMESHFIGWLFDGLSRGIHLEIRYIENDSELTVYYKGNIIFKETNGEVTSYVPGEWEDKIDSLYKIAFEKKKKKDYQKLEMRKIESKKDASNLQKHMINSWGI